MAPPVNSPLRTRGKVPPSPPHFSTLNGCSKQKEIISRSAKLAYIRHTTMLYEAFSAVMVHLTVSSELHVRRMSSARVTKFEKCLTKEIISQYTVYGIKTFMLSKSVSKLPAIFFSCTVCTRIGCRNGDCLFGSFQYQEDNLQ